MSERTNPSKEILDFRTIGSRIKDRRLQFHISTAELAIRAGVARYTIIRVEQGKPCTDKTLAKIRKALRLFTDQMKRPYADGPFAVHRAKDTTWTISISKKTYQQRLDDDDPLHVNDVTERRRLGSLGFQPFFTAILGCEISGSVAGHALMELHQPSWVDHHFGEEFIYCLRSSATILVDNIPCVLEPGDSMSFDATLPHQYLPTSPPGPDEEVPLILLVVSRRAGEELKALPE